MLGETPVSFVIQCRTHPSAPQLQCMTTIDSYFECFRRSGRPEDFTAFYEAAVPRVLARARSVAPSSADAEDLLQATFLGVLEGVSRFEPGRDVMPWLVSILSNQASLQRWRNQRRADVDHEHAKRAVWSSLTDPVEIAQDAEFVDHVEGGLRELGPIYQPVMTLHLRHGLNAKEISEVLDRPAGSVRTQIVRGMSMLRSMLPASLASTLLVQLAPARGVQAIGEALTARVGEHGHAGMRSWLGAKVYAVLALVMLGALAATWLVFEDTVGPEHDSTPKVPKTAVVEVAPKASGSTEDDVAPREEVPTDLSDAVLELRVVDEEGLLLPGKIVWLGRAKNFLLYSFHATADESGIARFEGLPRGAFHVEGSRGPQVVHVRPGTHRQEVVLVRGMTVTGRVVDGVGSPIADADVWLSDSNGKWMKGAGGCPATRTDAKGRFSLPHVFLGFIAASSDRHALSEVLVLPRDEDDCQLTIRLTVPGGKISMLVVDEDDEPIRNALVLGRKWFGDGPHDFIKKNPGIQLRVRTGNDGVFELTGFAKGSAVELRCWAVGFSRRKVLAIPGPHGARMARVTLVDAGTIEGRVLDASGSPVFGAVVTTDDSMSAHENPLLCGVGTDVEGRFTLTDADSGRVKVRAISQERTELTAKRETVVIPGLGRVEEVLNVEAGAVTHWEARLRDDTALHGRFVDSEGEPLVRHPVVLRAEEGVEDQFRKFKTFTDQDGRFRFSSVGSVAYELSLEQAIEGIIDGGPLVERYSGIRASTDSHDFTVPKAKVGVARILGRLVLDKGWGAEASSVYAMGMINDEGKKRYDSESGEFEIRWVRPGRYVLTAWIGEHAVPLRECEVTAGQDLDVGVLSLDAPGRIQITIDGDLGRMNFEELQVALQSDRHGAVSSLRREGGAFVSGKVPPGRYCLQVTSEGTFPWLDSLPGQSGHPLFVRRKVVEVTSGQLTTCAIEPAMGLRCKLTVDEPVDYIRSQNMVVTVFGADDLQFARVRGSQLGGSGPEAYVALPAGSYRATVETDAGQKGEASFVLVPDSDDPITVLVH